jgi:hypothetical protein
MHRATLIVHYNPFSNNFPLLLLLLFNRPLCCILLRSRGTIRTAVLRFLYLIKLSTLKLFPEHSQTEPPENADGEFSGTAKPDNPTRTL